MKRIEEKMRRIVRNAYFDYLISKDTQIYCTYATKMEMLQEMFPKTTNQEQLEKTWTAICKKKYL